MRLRPIDAPDLEAVRCLRNADRDAFFDNREISAEQQQRWFDGLAGRPVRFLVLEEDGAVVGTISVTDRGDSRELGNLVLDPLHRGRGLMRQAIRALTAEPGRYFAEVKFHNERSLNAFQQTGFRPVPGAGLEGAVRLELVVRQ